MKKIETNQLLLVRPPAKYSNPNSCQSYIVYNKRWVILVLFVFYSASNSMQWIQYSIINNIITKYYDIDTILIDWTSMIYMVLYVALVFPGSWLLEKVGLRSTALIGIIGTCIGSWIKVFSIDPNLFYIGFIGQSIVAASQSCILSLPAHIAAVWFGSNEISFACSIGVFGNQLGIAIGFLFPPIIVKNHTDLEIIGRDLGKMFYLVAILTTILAILMIIFFTNNPPTPPSAANAQKLIRAEATTEDGKGFTKTLSNLMTNRNYLLLLISYGINVGVFYAISTLLNPILIMYYPGKELDIGQIGLCIIAAGMVASLLSGFVLDKTRRFKETVLVLYIFSVIGMWIFSFTINIGYIVIVYITASFLGFFMTSYLFVGFEFTVEITYPESEGTSVGILNAVAQIFGILFTTLYGKLLNDFNDIYANVVMGAMLCLGLAVTWPIKSDLKRQKSLETTTLYKWESPAMH